MPDTPASIQDIIRAAAQQYKVPPDLALAISDWETRGKFNPDAKGTKGELGVMQLLPETAQYLGVDPSDKVQNVVGGVRYLKEQLDRYPDSVQHAVAAYNAGPGAVDATKPVPNQDYVNGVFGNLAKYRQLASAKPATSPPAAAATAPTSPGGPPPPRTGQFLGASTKPASIGPVTFADKVRDNLRSLTGAVTSTLPAVGATLGVAAGVPLGPEAIPLTTFIGGTAGKGVQQMLGDIGVGAPPPPTTTQRLTAQQQAGTEQMAYGAAGEAANAALGAVLPKPSAQAALATVNREKNLGLSFPELTPGTRTGTALDRLLNIAERSMAGGYIAKTSRMQWDQAVRDAAAQGKLSLAAIGKAKGTLEQYGGLVDQTAVKAEARRLFDTEIAPEIQAYSAQKGGAIKTSYGSIRPEDLSKFSPEAQDAIKASVANDVPQWKPRNPVEKQLQEILNSPDQVPFNAAAQKRSTLLELAKSKELMKTKAAGQATQLHQALTGVLEDANPDWGNLTHAYGEGRQLVSQQFVKQIVKKDPSKWTEAMENATGSTTARDLQADPEGQQAFKNLQQITQAAGLRTRTLPGRSFVPLLEYGIFHFAGLPVLAKAEGMAGLFTAAMYNPRIQQALLEGFKAPDAAAAMASFGRAIGTWTGKEPSAQESEPSGPPVPTSLATR